MQSEIMARLAIQLQKRMIISKKDIERRKAEKDLERKKTEKDVERRKTVDINKHPINSVQIPPPPSFDVYGKVDISVKEHNDKSNISESISFSDLSSGSFN